jgi:flagellar biosynthetic protein FliR
MKLDAAYVMAFFSVFVRLGALSMASPLMGKSVPVQVRALFCAVSAFALAPVTMPFLPPVPSDMGGLLGGLARDVMFGLLIAGCMQLVVATFQTAGGLLDFQLGVSSAQAFNPMMDTVASPVQQFKGMLATVLVLLMDGHHLMFRAFVESYALPVGAVRLDMALVGSVLGIVGRLMLLAVQIAAPVAGVSVIVDVAAGVVNKAVPQTQPFLMAVPAKLGFGMVALAFALPAMTVGVQRSLDLVFRTASPLLGGR